MPKGVEVTHANVVALLSDALPLFRHGDDEVWPLHHAHSFDVSVWEMWAGVASGATLISSPDMGDVGRLAELMLWHRATRLHVVPSVFHHLAEVVTEERLQLPLRQVVFCGEALNRRAVATWEGGQRGPMPEWVNSYGITETTVHNTYHALTPDEIHEHRATTPIGRAYHGSPALVVDERLRPVPVGQPGEILIGGQQVARGYLHDPVRTAERFVTVPDRPGRWYRSGDIAVPDADGRLHYVGRMDDQVKVRGFRIELGEIDNAIRALPWVKDAAVVVQESTRTESMLVAFVVPTAEARIPSGSLAVRLRETLRNRLPEYMIPGRAVLLETLPLNNNGKTDRLALRANSS